MRAKRFESLLVLSIAILGTSRVVQAGPMFTLNSTPSVSGLVFAAAATDFTPPVPSTGGAIAILGPPDNVGGGDPNVATMVDFGGGDLSLPWTVTVEFNAIIGDSPGIDVKVFGTQLDSTEGWELLASADGVAFTPIGTFTPPGQVYHYFAVEVDFNGTPPPAGSRFLRFIGTQVPIDAYARGFDFDAVGVVPLRVTPARSTSWGRVKRLYR